VLLGIVLWVHFVLPRLAYRQQPKLHDEYFLESGPKGIEFRTESVHSHLEWKLCLELLSDAHTHLLLYGKNVFTAIPRRVFAGPEQEAAFLELVRQGIGRPSGLRSMGGGGARA